MNGILIGLLLLCSCLRVATLDSSHVEKTFCLFTELKDETEFKIVRNLKLNAPNLIVNEEVGINAKCDKIVYLASSVFGALFYDTSQVPISRMAIMNVRYAIINPRSDENRIKILSILQNQAIPGKNKFMRSNFRGIALKKIPVYQNLIFEMDRKMEKYEMNLRQIDSVEGDIFKDGFSYNRAISSNMNFLNADHEIYKDTLMSLAEQVSEKIFLKMMLLTKELQKSAQPE